MTQKTWFITGASRGIGAEIAKAVLAAGDQLIATARKKSDLDQFESHPNALTLSLDITDEAQVQAAVAAGLERFGQIDVLVNNAGFGILGGIEETSAEEVERVYRTNVFGLLNMTRAVLPSMRQRRSGHIINLSSIGGYRSTPGWGVYSSTKFAVEGITEALHDELAPLGIHATVVEPGYFRTGFLDGSSLQHTAEISDYAETVGKVRKLASELSYQQPGDPTKLAQAMLQLANADTPPLRLPLGTDTLQAIAKKNAYVEQETAQWRALAESTDYR
ncbi:MULTISPECIES: oxidoreductase [Cyanophyceae]|uniref:oxidoreductase n=1 Tax=Cyanophyceae TaxID=3028117 RepID=UPI001688D4ED|nr:MULTISPECIES: oxidoreductase [Cyanophyceae]MBD1915112.1 SDR family NAD(P)-dependent oxidoreductase [Phormidium sp. FACHB-77]MBD2031998.1 SDR family NAD(P)-dependent oxidoreductase [Phormidium sp. FACHB-322]MBD2050472.1 SDR family NAD(P)-dependent oxidoreductase [Leptolyngbya sp. FACHB-60]